MGGGYDVDRLLVYGTVFRRVIRSVFGGIDVGKFCFDGFLRSFFFRRKS